MTSPLRDLAIDNMREQAAGFDTRPAPIHLVGKIRVFAKLETLNGREVVRLDILDQLQGVSFTVPAEQEVDVEYAINQALHAIYKERLEREERGEL